MCVYSIVCTSLLLCSCNFVYDRWPVKYGGICVTWFELGRGITLQHNPSLPNLADALTIFYRGMLITRTWLRYVQVCLSICLSSTRVLSDEMKELTVLALFWRHRFLKSAMVVWERPFPRTIFASVNHPFKRTPSITASEIGLKFNLYWDVGHWRFPTNWWWSVCVTTQRVAHLKFALKVTHPLWKTLTSTNICL